MPRPARVAPRECIYLVLTRGNNHQDVFKGEKDYQKYFGVLKKYKEKFIFNLYHHILMRNHVRKDYKWSSYNAYAYGRADEITDKHPIYKSLSGNEPERMKKYRDFVKGMIRD